MKGAVMNLTVVRWVASVVGVVVAVPALAAEPPARRETQAQVRVQIEPREAALVQQLPQASTSPGATALQKKGYDWLAATGGELALAPGRYTFALTRDAATVVSPSPVDVPAGRSQLRAQLEEHSHALGWVLVGTSPVVWYGSLMIFKGPVNDGDEVTGGQVAISTALAVAELVTGIVLISRASESATFTLVPAALAPARSRFGLEQHAVALQQPQGLSLQLAF
jgi:hypothetical protein